MDKFRVNTNGERDGRAVAEGNPEAENSSRRVTSQSQSSQFQPDNHRVDEQRFGFPSRASVDFQTLESSFGRLSFSDSSVPQNGNPVLHNRYNQVINGGGGFRFPPRELESQQMNPMLQRLSLQNDSVNGSYANGGQASTSVMQNNAFLNGNLRDFPYPSRNRLSDQSSWDYTNGFVSGINEPWRNNEGFGYNHDPLPSMENEISSINSILSLAKDRVYSKELLKNVVESSRETFDLIFNDLIFHICELMVDPFGHDVFQKLVEKCSSEQITQIVDVVTENQHQFVHICLDSLGTRAIQLLLRNIRLRSEDQILRIVGTISMVALQLARSNNAKHVIVECFNEFPLSHCKNLLEVIARNCYWIAIDQHGCCMLQHCLIKECTELRRRLIFEIIANALKLCLNCYGNYVVQYVVELENRQVTALLVRQLAGSYAYLSRNKYGSHAVQKFLKIKDIDSTCIVNDLLREIDTLLLDPYGNYVIQTVWFVSKDDVRSILRWHIESNIRLMRCNKFGKKILEKLNL